MPESKQGSADRRQAQNSAAPIDKNAIPRNLDVVQDISVNLSMELGRTKITIKDLLQLNQGSVVELDRSVDEHMDILVNGTLVAHGEVVVINDKFGIRLTDIASPMERVNKLK